MPSINSQGTGSQSNGGKQNNGGRRFATNPNQYTNSGNVTSPYQKKTRAGLLPDDDRVPYSIKTGQITAYLQHKIDVMIADINAQLSEDDKPLGAIPINGYTIKFTSTHYPFIVILPGSVEYKTGRRPKRDNGPRTSEVDISQDVNDDDSSNDKLTIFKPLYSILQPYMYPKGFFKKNERCAQMRLSNNQREQCDRLSTPKKSNQKGGQKSIMLMLDPFAIIHEMLEIQGDNRSFMVMMNDSNKLKDGDFKYRVKRTFRKGKKGNKGVSELKSLLRLGSGGTGATLK